MPNRSGVKVSVDDTFFPQAQVAPDLGRISRPAGEGAAAASAAAASVAKSLGSYADEQTVLAGKQEGTRAGLKPDYRPTGGTTLYDQSFNTAATQTYLGTVEAKTRSSIQDAFEANRDNPVALKSAFEKLHADMTHPATGEVFPEIQGKFETHFAELNSGYRKQALANFDSIQKDQDKAQLFKNLSDNSSTTQRALAALDPDDPATERVVLGAAASKAVLYKGAADREAITAAAAAKLSIDAHNEAWIGLIGARAVKLGNAEAVDKYAKDVEARFAKGEFKGLDGNGFEVLKANLAQLASRMATADKAASTQLGKSIDDYVKREANGETPPPDEWTGIAAAAKTMPGGDEALALGLAKRKLAAQIRASSVIDGDRIVSGLRDDLRTNGGVYPARRQLLDFGQKLVDSQRKEFQSDLLGTAQKKGMIAAVTPLDFEGFAKSEKPIEAAGGLAVQFQARASQARAVSSNFSRAPQFLRPEEKLRLKEIVDQGGDRALLLAGSIVRGAGDDAPAMLREISSDAPLLAQAGNIVANGGSMQAARDAFKANEVKKATGKELPSPDRNVAMPAFRDEFGSAYVMQPEDGGRIRVTADAIAKTRIAAGSVDPKSSEAGTIYKRALQEASGASFVDGVQYGGVASYKPGLWSSYKVVVPAGVKADAFRDVVRSLRDEDLSALPIPPQTAEGKPYRARDFADATPIAVRGGYRFALGDVTGNDPKYIRGADGRPFVLPFDAMAPALRARVPGAFLGGR